LSATTAVATSTTSLCSTGEEINKKILDTFTELARDLRRLRDLPLSINSLQGTSPVFRYTEVQMTQYCTITLALGENNVFEASFDQFLHAYDCAYADYLDHYHSLITARCSPPSRGTDISLLN
jgi:hypothetical protein